MEGSDMTRVTESKECIHIEEAKVNQFFGAIIDNNVEGIENIINLSKGSEMYNKYLNGHFDFQNAYLEKQVSSGNLHNIQLPLAIAAVCGATESIKALLQAGVSPKQVDCHGNNVVHSMIAYLHYHSDMEDAIVSKFQLLVDTVSVDVMREILHHENSFGLRPIEFAAQHGQGSMVLAIMNTPGVYLTKQQVVGLTCYKWYNITEYESTRSGSRWDKSPLMLLTYVDTDHVDERYINTLRDIVIKSWLEKKNAINFPFICIWVLIRFCFLLVYMILDLDFSVDASEQNNTHCIPEAALILPPSHRTQLTIYLTSMAALSLFIDAVELIRMLTAFKRYLFHTISGRKNLFRQYSLYRGSQFILTLSIVIFTPLTYFHSYHWLHFAYGVVRVLCPFFAGWSSLFFVQLLPGIGLFICTIYSMMVDLMKLIVVYLLMIVPFTQSFYHFINSHSVNGCLKGFQTVFESSYSLFLMMLNMVDLTEHDVQHIELLHVTHVVYVFTVSIMLVNFFVAVMADSVANACARKKITVPIQRVGVSISLEYRLRWLMKPYYNFMIRRHFVCEETDVFLIGAYSYSRIQNAPDVSKL